MTDIAGNEISPGCVILYAAKFGSSSILHWGKVERVKTIPQAQRGGGVKHSITFRGVVDLRHAHPVIRSTLSTLHDPTKVVVIPWESKIPERIRRLLDPDGKHSQSTGLAG